MMRSATISGLEASSLGSSGSVLSTVFSATGAAVVSLSSERKNPGATKPVMPSVPSTRTTTATMLTITVVLGLVGGWGE